MKTYWNTFSWYYKWGKKNFSAASWQEVALIICVQELKNYNLMSKVQTDYEASNKTNHSFKVQPVKTEKIRGCHFKLRERVKAPFPNKYFG